MVNWRFLKASWLTEDTVLHERENAQLREPHKVLFSENEVA